MTASETELDSTKLKHPSTAFDLNEAQTRICFPSLFSKRRKVYHSNFDHFKRSEADSGVSKRVYELRLKEMVKQTKTRLII